MNESDQALLAFVAALLLGLATCAGYLRGVAVGERDRADR